jgi:hypothetical protein
MAITQEREEMRIAHQLKNNGWIYEMYNGNRSNADLRAMADWCRDSFGPMYNDMTWAGKWFGAELPFQAGGITPQRQFVFMFRDDKLYTMFKVMFPE